MYTKTFISVNTLRILIWIQSENVFGNIVFCPSLNICWLRQPVSTLSGCLRNSIRSGSETAAAGLRNQFQNSAKTQLEVCEAFAKPALCVQWCWSGLSAPSTLKNMSTYNLRDWYFVTVPAGTQLPDMKAGMVVVLCACWAILVPPQWSLDLWRDNRAQTGLGGKGLVFCFVFLQKRKWSTVFYVEMDFGSSPPLWTFDPRLVSRREVGFDGIGPGFDWVLMWCQSGLKKNGTFFRKFL